jgi:tripartite ATP-independent transporter DctP family solute receptor
MTDTPSRGRRRALRTLSATAATGLAAGPWIGARAQSPRVIRLAHHVSLQSEQQKAAENFARLVQQYSNGAIEVRVLPAAQMGGQREIIESVSLGALEMGYGESGLYGNYVPRFGVIALPYLYRDFAHWEKVVDGPIGAGLAAELQKTAGLRIVNWMTAGYRDTYLRTKPVNRPDDFRGVKIRLPEAPLFVRTFQALGAQPTPIPAPEMYSALQTGVVDAMEGSAEVGYTFKIHEVTKFLSRTRHILLDGSFVIGNKLHESLPKDQQAAIDRAAKEAAATQRKEHFEREAGWMNRFRTESKLVINDVDQKAFAERLTPLQGDFANAAKAADVLAAIKAA